MDEERNATHPFVTTSTLGESDVYVLTFIYTLLMSIGFCANLLIIVSIFRAKLLRKRPQFVLMNVLFCDILTSVIAGPYHIFSTTCRRVPQRSDSLVNVCRTYLYLSYSLGFISIFSLLLVSIDRYTAVVRPYAYQRHVTNERVVMMSLLGWFTPFLLTLPAPLTPGWLEFEGLAFGLCGVQWSRMSKSYTATLIAICFLAPTVIIFFTNIRVFMIAHKQKRLILASQSDGAGLTVLDRKDSVFYEEQTSKVEDNKRGSAASSVRRLSRMVSFNNKKLSFRQSVSVSSHDVQIAVATLLLITFYMLSWLPFVVPRLLEAFRLGPIPERVTNYSPAFAFSNVAWDPLLILWCRKEIRKAVKLIFCRGNRVGEVFPGRRQTSFANSNARTHLSIKEECKTPDQSKIPMT